MKLFINKKLKFQRILNVIKTFKIQINQKIYPIFIKIKELIVLILKIQNKTEPKHL